MNQRVVIAAGVYPPEAGGVASVSFRLARDLAALDVEVAVIAYRQPRVPSPHSLVEKRIQLCSVSRSGGLILRYLRYLLVLFRVTKPGDVVLVTDSLSTGLPARILSLTRRLKIIVRLGGERSWEDAVQAGRVTCSLKDYWALNLGGWRQVLMKSYYRWFFSMAERVVLVSPLLLSCLKQVIPSSPTRTMIVPNRLGASVASKFSAQDRPRTPFRLLYVGRMYRLKNIVFLARVLRACVMSGLVVEMTFIGSGDQEEVAKRILAGITGVTFLGDRSLSDVQRAMDQADLLLLPSLTDIYPNTVIESLTRGLPVCMTTEHGLEPGFGGAVFVSPSDEDAWIRQIQRLMDPEEYAKLLGAIYIPPYIGSGLVDLLLDV